MDRSDVLVAAHSLSLVFSGPVRALDSLTLSVSRGEFVAVVGPSGCGKSTFLRLVAGLIAPTSGTILVADEPPDEARRSAVRMSFVFQEATLLPWRSVADNVRLPLEIARTPRERGRELVRHGLNRVGLAEFADRYPRQLSGGMRMRASLARALVTEPQLLLMDEPFAALDDMTRQRLNEELLALWAEQGWTVIFVTHNIAEAVFLSQRVLVMSARPGRIVADVPVPFGRQRNSDLRTSVEFAQLAGEVSGQLRRGTS